MECRIFSSNGGRMRIALFYTNLQKSGSYHAACEKPRYVSDHGRHIVAPDLISVTMRGIVSNISPRSDLLLHMHAVNPSPRQVGIHLVQAAGCDISVNTHLSEL